MLQDMTIQNANPHPPGQVVVQLQDWMGSDRAIAEAAWTSSTTLQGIAKKTDEEVRTLVERLVTDGHGVPFESVVLRFWMRVPVAVDRQIMTHRMASMSGMSGRYRTMPDDVQEVPADVVAIFEKYGYDIVNYYDDVTELDHTEYRDFLSDLRKLEAAGTLTNAEYKRAREFLRGILPQSSMTERTCIINLRSLTNFLRLRLSPHAQPEIREVALQMWELVSKAEVCPNAFIALGIAGWQIDKPNHEWLQYVR